MDADSVSAMVAAGFEDGEVFVDGAGANYNITVVSEQFAGKRPVARQQAVYAVLGEEIASGRIHAVNISTFTRDEWSAASS